MSEGRVVTATVLFTDVVESTAQRIALGDDAADALSLAHDGRLRAEVVRNNGRVVKAMGDGIMAIFDSATDAVSAAIAIQRLTERESRTAAADERILLRVGISAGDVQVVDDDYHGTPIVEAKRLEAAAQPAQILVSDKVRSLAGSRGNHGYEGVGELELKGLPDRIAAFAVTWAPEGASAAEPAPDTAAPPAKPRRRGRIVAIVGVVVIVALIAGTIAVVASGKHTDAHGAAADVKPTTYKPQLDAVKCPAQSSASHSAVLTVPEDRTKPNGRKVKLAVGITSTGGSAGKPPTVRFGGQPFDAGLVNAGSASGDVVDLALRGWTGSNPELRCPEIGTRYFEALAATGTGGAFAPASQQQFLASARTCHEQLERAGIDLGAYTRDASADDLRDLAVAEGWKQMNVETALSWSGIALDFARRYPTLTRAVVIQDPVPPDDSEFSSLVSNAGDAWARYVAACTASQPCTPRYGNLAATFSHLYETLNARPVTTQAKPTGGPIVKVRLTGDLGASTLYAALKTPAALPLIASVVASKSPKIIAGFIAQQAWDSRAYDFGAFFTDSCTYGLPQRNPVQVDASLTAYPEFRSIARDPRFDVCEVWKVPNASAVASLAPRSAPAPIAAPGLVIGGALYPDSSPDAAKAVGAEFRQAAVVVLPSLGSDPLDSGNTCLSQLRSDFLANPTTKLHPDDCVHRIPPVAFTGVGATP